jgi:putative membrane protein
MNKLLAIAAVLSLSSACVGFRDLPSETERLSSATVFYVESIASGDRFEVESSRLALAKSQDPAVRSYAAMLIRDHERMSDDLRDAVRTFERAEPAFALVSHHEAWLQRLREASTDFDPLYRDFQVAAHQEALELHQGYATAGDLPAVQRFAAGAAPIIARHLQQAQALPVPPTPATLQYAPDASPQLPRRPGERG